MIEYKWKTVQVTTFVNLVLFSEMEVKFTFLEYLRIGSIGAISAKEWRQVAVLHVEGKESFSFFCWTVVPLVIFGKLGIRILPHCKNKENDFELWLHILDQSLLLTNNWNLTKTKRLYCSGGYYEICTSSSQVVTRWVDRDERAKSF